MARLTSTTTLIAALLLVAVSFTAVAAVNTKESSTRKKALKAKAPRGRSGRIVGGREVDDYDEDTGVHFIAKLFLPDGNGFYCSGSVISKSGHVLTRAGCEPRVNDVVRLGGSRLYNGVVARVAKVSIHPKYDPAGEVADVAVLKLKGVSESRLLRAGVVPVFLNRVWDNPHGMYFTGYGATDKAAQSAGSLTLKRAYLPVAPWWNCRRITDTVVVPGLSRPGLPISPAAQVCLRGGRGAGALCERDPGGPMYRVSTHRGVKIYTLYAVSSYWIGLGADNRCPRAMPNVGSKVAFYYSWIQNQV
uniref:Serine protease-like protein n=1 Tax=Porphyra purpurea TaxID=2787 RepID=Q40953_PORPU|nr:Serine protease-like protein; Two of the three residues in the serine protease H/D/S charge relay triad are replaced in this protein by G-98 and P-247, suggesting that it is not a serine protease [Porphyra purpurea]